MEERWESEDLKLLIYFAGLLASLAGLAGGSPEHRMSREEGWRGKSV